jgi:7-cyano-7-deazaguanine reductase
MKSPRIETLPNKHSKNRFLCHHVFPELTALCPVTKLPDFYIVRLSYEPGDKLVELKSLKSYFLKFRDSEILHEEVTNRILNDFITAVRPRWARILTKVNVRGGLYTTVVRQWSEKEGDKAPSFDMIPEEKSDD